MLGRLDLVDDASPDWFIRLGSLSLSSVVEVDEAFALNVAV